MATSRLIGTPATTTLWMVQAPGPVMTPISPWTPATQADIAAIQTGILDDSVPIANPFNVTGAFIPGGQQLIVPNRGVLKILPGDIVAFDPFTGWPILISARSAANASAWTHT